MSRLPKLNENDPRYLLVEGPDDQGVAIAMLAQCKIADVYVGHRDGYERLRAKARPLLEVSGRTHFGIVVDADDNVSERWQSLTDTLRGLGYHFPTDPVAGGFVADPVPSRPRLGLWLMPDNRRPGMVEDFISDLTPPGDALLERARAAVAGIPAGQIRFKPTYRVKAEIHTWLAWQEEPGRPMGQAITKQWLAAEADDVAAPFRAWLNRLYG